MIRIQRQTDLERLRKPAVSSILATAAEAQFVELKDAFDVSPFGREFVLDNSTIVVVENTDDEASVLRYLSGGFPEWGELDHSVDPPVLKFVVCFDNDCLDTVFTNVGTHPTVDKWIEPYLES